MKNLLLLAFAALALAACNDNDDSPRFAAENTKVADGSLTGSNMHFLGTWRVTLGDAVVYDDDKARIEFAGLDEFTLYLHRVRFAAAMPAIEMRLYAQPYTPGSGARFAFDLPRVVPEVSMPNAVGGGATWTPFPAYTLTEVEGSVDDTRCRIAFDCNAPAAGGGVYSVAFEGRLLDE